MLARFYGLILTFGLALTWAGGALAQGTTKEKVLRYAFEVAETGFDPAQVTDLYSRIINASMFDALYTYDYLARPAKIRPNIAAELPVVSNDYKT